jgi:hypothetical protein
MTGLASALGDIQRSPTWSMTADPTIALVETSLQATLDGIARGILTSKLSSNISCTRSDHLQPNADTFMQTADREK